MIEGLEYKVGQCLVQTYGDDPKFTDLYQIIETYTTITHKKRVVYRRVWFSTDKNCVYDNRFEDSWLKFRNRNRLKVIDEKTFKKIEDSFKTFEKKLKLNLSVMCQTIREALD